MDKLKPILAFPSKDCLGFCSCYDVHVDRLSCTPESRFIFAMKGLQYAPDLTFAYFGSFFSSLLLYCFSPWTHYRLSEVSWSDHKNLWQAFSEITLRTDIPPLDSSASSNSLIDSRGWWGVHYTRENAPSVILPLEFVRLSYKPFAEHNTRFSELEFP